MQVKSLSYVLYVLRWMVLAIPGAWFLVQVQCVIENTYLAMVISQGLLGAVVYFIDRWIFCKCGDTERRSDNYVIH